MEQQDRRTARAVARLIPREPARADMHAFTNFGVFADAEADDVFCAHLEELSRHLRWLDDDYQLARLDRLEARARSIMLLADRLGLRSVGQVSADVAYCIDNGDETALAATLSRLMRLITQALDQAAGQATSF